MRKTSLALIMALLVTAAAGTLLVSLGNANPYMYHESVPAPAFVKPTNIAVTSPKENVLYSTNGTIALSFSVTGPDAPKLLTKYISIVDYKGDWMQDTVHAYRTKNFEVYTPDDFPFFLQFNFDIIGIPAGRHSITVTTFAGGGYAEGLTWYSFGINSSATVNFTMGAIPIVSFLVPQNSTFEGSSVPLNFTVDQPTSEITYSLDGQEKRTISENTTLTDLLNGVHNVTIHVIGEFGNLGGSETLYFNVDLPPQPPDPLPVLPIAAATAVVAVIIVAAGLLLYNRKRHREAQQK